MKTVTQTKFRNDLGTYLNGISDSKEPVVITRQKGLPLAVVWYEEYLEFKQFKESKNKRG